MNERAFTKNVRFISRKLILVISRENKQLRFLFMVIIYTETSLIFRSGLHFCQTKLFLKTPREELMTVFSFFAPHFWRKPFYILYICIVFTSNLFDAFFTLLLICNLGKCLVCLYLCTPPPTGEFTGVGVPRCCKSGSSKQEC